MPSYESLPYRPCVGVVLFNRAGRVFIGPRQTGRRSPAAMVSLVLTVCAFLGAIMAWFVRSFMETSDVERKSNLELWWAMTVPVMMFAMPLTLIVMTERRRRWRQSFAQRGFAVEIEK